VVRGMEAIQKVVGRTTAHLDLASQTLQGGHDATRRYAMRNAETKQKSTKSASQITESRLPFLYNISVDGKVS
jgi:hypothetical protein